MANKSSDPKADVFRKYIADKVIVIADTSAISRAALAKNLVEMGAKMSNIALASTYQEGEAQIAERSPRIVIADYDLGRRCGLELLQNQRARHVAAKDTLFILVTGNTSQTAVARAAEEDVDCYILKPFTANTLRLQIIKTALAKINPSEYAKAIEAGKKTLAEGKVDEAVLQFESAMKLDSAPSLACFYRGQGMEQKKALGPAEGDYARGIGFNKIHYKCMVGMFDLLMSQNRTREAYEVVKRISQYFPANPQRLTTVLKLAIMTQSYEDVEKYYQVFTRIEERNEDVISSVCAALVVCGKYYLQGGFNTRAGELFSKAAITAQGRSKILKEIIFALCSHGQPKDAQEYLKRFPAENQSTALYQALELYVSEQMGVADGIVLDRGRKLLAQGTYDPLIYEVMIRRSVSAGLEDPATQLARQAVQKFPEEKSRFDRALLPEPAEPAEPGGRSGA